MRADLVRRAQTFFLLVIVAGVLLPTTSIGGLIFMTISPTPGPCGERRSPAAKRGPCRRYRPRAAEL
jgi:hypothetical protein